MRVRDARLLVVVSAALLGAAIASPLGVIASHQFTDVPNSNTFHDDIDAIRDAGVTTGCALNLYCPKDFVTREQMAAFLNRLGALGPGKSPVVNADKVDGQDASDFLGAGDIVIPQRGPWVPFGADDIAISHLVADTTFAVSAGGGPVAILPLQAPGTIDGLEHGIESVRVCFSPSTNVAIYATRLWQQLETDEGSELMHADLTARDVSADGCYTVTDPTPTAVTGGAFLTLTFNFAGAGTALMARCDDLDPDALRPSSSAHHDRLERRMPLSHCGSLSGRSPQMRT